MATWTLEIEVITPSANVYDRMHWRKKRKLSKDWFFILYEAICEKYFHDEPLRRAKKKRQVDVVRYSRGTLDEGNVWTPVDKMIFDNLVKLGILVDDSPKWLKPTVVPRKAKRNRMKIEIWNGLAQPSKPVKENA